MNRSQFLRLIVVLLLTTGSLLAVQPAWTLKSSNEYTDLMAIKAKRSKIYIHEHSATELKYGMYENDPQPTTIQPWTTFDVLYEDVPSSYETALNLIAQGSYADALKMLERAESDKTSISREVFSDTDIGKLFLDAQKLICYRNLGNDDKTAELYKKIRNNKSAHAWARLMVDYAGYLNTKGEGGEALSVLDELKDLTRVPNDMILDIRFEKIRAMASNAKYKDAKSELDQLLIDMGETLPGVKERVTEMRAEILIYHEKNYREGIRFFQDIIENNPVGASGETYMMLGTCYENTGKLAQARWNYIQAFLGCSTKNKEMLKNASDSILKINKQMQGESNDKMNAFFEKTINSL